MIPVDTPVGTVCRLLKRWAQNHDTAGNQHTLGDPDVPAGSLVTIRTSFNYAHYAFCGVHDPARIEANGGFGVRLHAFDYKGNPDNYHFAHPSVLELDVVTDEEVRAVFGRTFRFDDNEETA